MASYDNEGFPGRIDTLGHIKLDGEGIIPLPGDYYDLTGMPDGTVFIHSAMIVREGHA